LGKSLVIYADRPALLPALTLVGSDEAHG